ncbi:MAG TPA: hypothetical protein VM513_33060 [Kofleriaceae bacterium]|nr:hypothetical protein [Kofleriaceae bacterium]
MRSLAGLALASLLAGCPSTTGGECLNDPDCEGSEVCGRDGTCASSSSVRQVTVMWTVNGAPATMTSCAAHPDLFVTFHAGPGDTLGYAPVPCFTGQFNIDKLPLRFTSAELGVDGSAMSSTKAITGATVAFDLR